MNIILISYIIGALGIYKKNRSCEKLSPCDTKDSLFLAFPGVRSGIDIIHSLIFTIKFVTDPKPIEIIFWGSLMKFILIQFSMKCKDTIVDPGLPGFTMAGFPTSVVKNLKSENI